MHKLRRLAQVSIKSRQVVSLPKVAYRCEPFKARNPPDYVYGILGLLDPSAIGKTFSLIVDYNISHVEVFANAARWCLEMDRNWDILSLSGGCVPRNGPTSNLGPVSWVPDFCNGAGKTTSFILGKSAHVYCAGGSELLEIGMDYWYEDNRRTLVVRCFVVDTIVTLSDVSPSDDCHIRWCRNARDIARANSLDDVKTVLDTLLAGRATVCRSNLDQQDRYAGFQRLVMENAAIKGHWNKDQTWQAVRATRNASTFEIETAILYSKTASAITRNRRFAITLSKRPALVSRGAQEGDRICVFPGGKVPFIIRKTEDTRATAYLFISDCFVHGLMNGEALSGEKEEIRLV
jgi:hypothetical protein